MVNDYLIGYAMISYLVIQFICVLHWIGDSRFRFRERQVVIWRFLFESIAKLASLFIELCIAAGVSRLWTRELRYVLEDPLHRSCDRVAKRWIRTARVDYKASHFRQLLVRWRRIFGSPVGPLHLDTEGAVLERWSSSQGRMAVAGGRNQGY